MLLLEDNLSNAIKKLLKKEDQLRIAVAFIGDGASKLFGPKAEDVKIICNLSFLQNTKLINGAPPHERF